MWELDLTLNIPKSFGNVLKMHLVLASEKVYYILGKRFLH